VHSESCPKQIVTTSAGSSCKWELYSCSPPAYLISTVCGKVKLMLPSMYKVRDTLDPSDGTYRGYSLCHLPKGLPKSPNLHVPINLHAPINVHAPH
jgi:hypothetical protein